MPFINPKHVVSFSSEDKVQCADNLLKPESYRKWRTSSGGEGQASVVLQLEKAEQIHSIDVGNEGSTFVEVLVGDSDAEVKIDYQVLLGASAFMTPVEAKAWTNINKVRMFGPAALNKTTREKKWSRVKVVVTQNFNKTHPFGLAFVKLHSPPSDNATAASSAATGEAKESDKKFGMFSMKAEASVSPKPILAGTLFDRVKREPETTPPAGGAAAVRLASSIPISPKPTGIFKLKTEESTLNKNPFASTPSKPETSVVKAETETSSPSDYDTKVTPSKPISKPAAVTPQNGSKLGFAAGSATKKRPSSPSSGSGDASSSKKPKLSSKKKIPQATSVPFGEVLKGVTIVLSGYQNPLRGVVRDKALEMGAKYKPDWDSTSTHLICAFSNTPKFTQVLGKGKIVTKRWIEDCHMKKSRLPWRDYRLDDGSDGSDSDDGSGGGGGSSGRGQSDVKAETEQKRNPDGQSRGKNESKKTKGTAVDAEEEEEEDEYAGTTDVDSDVEEQTSRRPGGADDDDPDTEDELQRVMAKTNDIPKPKPQKEDEASLPPLPVLPDFFSEKQFLLFGKFDPASRKQLNRYIIAYGGRLNTYMSAGVDFVVTSSTWDSNFDDAIAENPVLQFVRPKWVKACHQKLKLVPYQPYIVAPPIDDDDDDDI